MRGNDEDERVRSQKYHTVAELIGRGEQTKLLTAIRRFDPPGVDDDVLRSRCKRNDKRKRPKDHQSMRRTEARHHEEPCCHDSLRKQHPGTSVAHSPKQRWNKTVDERRPKKLHRIGNSNPGNESYIRERCPLLAKPIAECVAGQKERQP